MVNEEGIKMGTRKIVLGSHPCGDWSRVSPPIPKICSDLFTVPCWLAPRYVLLWNLSTVSLCWRVCPRQQDLTLLLFIRSTWDFTSPQAQFLASGYQMQGHVRSSHPVLVRVHWTHDLCYLQTSSVGQTLLPSMRLLGNTGVLPLPPSLVPFSYSSTGIFFWENLVLTIFTGICFWGTQLKTEMIRILPEISERIKEKSVILFYLLGFELSPAACLRYLDVPGKKINSLCTSRFIQEAGNTCLDFRGQVRLRDEFKHWVVSW